MTDLSQMRVANPAAIVLERLARDAHAGMIVTVAVIAVTPKGQFAILTEGGQKGELLLATNLLHSRLIRELESPQNKTSIIRPVGI